MTPFRASSSPGTHERIGIALLLLAILAAYHGSFAVPFFFDDDVAITHNPSIRTLWRLDRVLVPPADGSAVTGRPLVNLSLAFNYAWGGTNPRGYHVLNLFLHGTSALVLFGLIRRTLLLSRVSLPLGANPDTTATVVALIWALHPLQTESVTCVIQRTELLVSLFYLLTLYCFVRALGAAAARAWSIGAIAACALGMASKEVMVSAPLVALLYDRTFAGGSFRSAWRLRGRLHLGLAATWLVLIAVLLAVGGQRGSAAGFGLGTPWWAYALKQSDAIVTYLKLSLWPHPLVIDYGTAIITDPIRVLPQLAFIAVMLAGTVAALRWRPQIGFLAFWFVGILAPSSSVVPLVTQTVAEHRMYLALAPLVMLGFVGLQALLGRHVFKWIAPLILALGVGVAARNALLQDELALWAETAARVPDNPRAHASLGLALSERGQAEAAIPHFERARSLDPGSVATEQNLGNAWFQLRHYPEAVSHFRRVVALNPKFAGGYNNLGAALLETGDTAGALEAFQTALQLEPDYVGARQNLARAFFARERFAEAVPHYEYLVRLQPASAEEHYNLGLALARTGNLNRAAEQFMEALRLKPGAGSYLNFARFLIGAGRGDEAAAALEAALRLRPDFPEARQELDRLRTALGPAKATRESRE